MKKLKRKLQSRAGESIAETLIAVLIAALALVMLAGAMSTARDVITKGKNKLNEYYGNNETMWESGTEYSSGITIVEKEPILGMTVLASNIEYYKNDAFGQKTVIAYKVK